jgi:hypothetical protein
MAVDTENRRRSAGQHLCLTIHPVPNSSIDAADRANATWIYSGLFVGGGGDSKGGWIAPIIRRRRRNGVR